jgi:membrane-bound metal-dependent hydrolase YbcI (DUF457 family)
VDNVTHTLIGVGAANAFLRRRAGPAAAPILAIASNLPDIDVLVHATGDPAAITLRRTFGHSLLLLPLWCLLLALVLRRFHPRLPLVTLFGLCLFGAAIHLVFDLVNSFGVLLLWPLSSWRPELAMVFILDPVLSALTALPLLLCLPTSMRPRLVGLSRLALAGVALYLGVCAGGRALAGALLEKATAGRTGVAPEFVYVFPEPLGPHRWRGVVRRGGVYTLWLLRPWRGAAERALDLPTRPDEPAVRAVRASPVGARLERFFKAPVWEIAGDGGQDRVCVWDLRFRPLAIERGAAFRFCFTVDGNGRVGPAPLRPRAPP